MSTKYKVCFKSIKDRYTVALEGAKLDLIRKVLKQLKKNFDWPQLPEKFLFVKIPSYRPSKNRSQSLNVTSFYKVHRGVQGDLVEPEIILCFLIQDLMKASKNEEDFMKLIATAFEEYVLAEKRSRDDRSVYANANLEIRGAVVDYNGYRTVDIGIDKLDDEAYLEMDECCLTVFGFSTHKDTQIGFYAECFKQVRQEIGAKAKLKLELIAAAPSGKSLQSLIVPYLPNLKMNDVVVEGITYWPSESIRL